MKNIAVLCPHRESDQWTVPISFIEEFKRLGYITKVYSTFDLNDNYSDIGLKQLIADNDTGIFVPDIVINLDFGLFQSSLLAKKSIPEAKWILESGDDPQSISLNYQKAIAGAFDLVFSPDIRCVHAYIKHGIRSMWCPHFADERIFADVTQSIEYDCVTTRSDDEPFFKELKIRLGDRFQARPCFLEGKDHTRHLMKGKIVVQNSKYKEITRRIFEGLLAKRLVITDRLPKETCIDEIFTENKDIVYFDNIDDCIEKINFYSANDSERDLIAESGYLKVSKYHTVKARIKQILELINRI